MRYGLVFFISFLVFVSPAFCELTDADLDKIKLIVNESVQPLREDIAGMKEQIKGLDNEVATGFDNVDKRFVDMNNQLNRIFWLLVGILTSAVGLVTTFLIYVIKVLESSGEAVSKSKESAEHAISLVQTMQEIKTVYQENTEVFISMIEKLQEEISIAKESESN